MKKLLWISIALALIGCGKQAQAETTVTPTTIVSETTAETTTLSETTVAIVEETISGDQHQQNQDMMNVIRQEVIDGDIKGVEIDEEVDMWCDFLSDTEKAEFKSELHLLEVKEAEVVPETTKPQPTKPSKSQTSSKPKETQAKPAPQPTQSTEVYQESAPQPTQPVVNEPAPQPETQPAVEPGSTVKDANGNEVHRGKLDTNQTLTDEQIDAINNSTWN